MHRSLNGRKIFGEYSHDVEFFLRIGLGRGKWRALLAAQPKSYSKTVPATVQRSFVARGNGPSTRWFYSFGKYIDLNQSRAGGRGPKNTSESSRTQYFCRACKT